MNVEILEILMQSKKVPSYYQLAARSGMPYTTLLDLAHGKSKNLDNIKYLSDYFEVDFTLLLEPTSYYCVITEENELKTVLPFDRLERSNPLVTLLMQKF